MKKYLKYIVVLFLIFFYNQYVESKIEYAYYAGEKYSVACKPRGLRIIVEGVGELSYYREYSTEECSKILSLVGQLRVRYRLNDMGITEVNIGVDQIRSAKDDKESVYIGWWFIIILIFSMFRWSDVESERRRKKVDPLYK